MTPAESGAQFRVVVTNTQGSVTSNPATLTLAGAAPWWNTQWPYRVEVQVGAAGYARTDQVVEAGINFTTLLAGLGVTGAFAPDSVRVVEANGAGAVTDDHIRYQFDGVSSYEPTTNADGQVVFEMEGATAANQTRRYFVYFGLTTNGIPPFEQDWRIDTINNIIDEGQSSYKIESPGGTWFLQKAAGGFSSLLDANGNDWLSYNSAAGAAGRFRGIPNMVYPEGDLHPGTNLSSTTLRGNGPLRATLQTNTLDDRFGVRWDIYPTHATATITKALAPYWFLYEGTPGGSLQGGGNDYIYRSDGAVNNTGVAWNPQKDIPGKEWLYFADTALNRALYVVHHEDDNAFEYYSPQGTAPNQMTVFGFGRTTEGPLLTRGNQHFTVGLIDSLNPGTVEAQIDRATKPLNLYVAYAQNQTPPTVPAAPVVTAVERGDKSVTLTWEPLLQHGGAAVTSYEISRTPAGPTTVVPGTATSAVVTGLTNGTSYTFTIRARNSVGLGPASAPTDPVAPGTAPSFVSDVFNRDTLDAKWRVDDPNALDPLSPDYPADRFPATFVPDPTQAATVVSTGQELVIKVPAGSSHDLYDSNLMAPRVLQSVANEDLSLTAKYSSVPTTLYQFEGIVAQNDHDSFLRFDLVWAPDFFHPNGALQAQALLVENKLGQKLGGVYVDPATRYLRVSRDGNLWTLESSIDGTAWTAITQFPYTMQITEVGLHAGNHYTTVPSATPEFISRVDYVLNDDAPLPDDPIPDTTQLQISDVDVHVSSDRARVRWHTNELSTGTVKYGLTPALELGQGASTEPDFDHEVLITGLSNNTSYLAQINVTDVRGQTATHPNLTFTTLAAGATDTEIDVWYGLNQAFGFRGQPQRWINVLANIADVDGIASAVYTVNGGEEQRAHRRRRRPPPLQRRRRQHRDRLQLAHPRPEPRGHQRHRLLRQRHHTRSGPQRRVRPVLAAAVHDRLVAGEQHQRRRPGRRRQVGDRGRHGPADGDRLRPAHQRGRPRVDQLRDHRPHHRALHRRGAAATCSRAPAPRSGSSCGGRATTSGTAASPGGASRPSARSAGTAGRPTASTP